jgi:S1-C subfamily serine protease
MLFLFMYLVPCLAQAPTQRLALLVGCTQYPNLKDKKKWELAGPTNDVDLMKSILNGQFGFRPEQIVTLSGWPEQPELRPTRANIEREFKRLADIAGKGDQVVILLSGHGSQQPADDDANDPEPDGFDEIFLPADVKGWNGEKGSIENAIVDDEIRAWLTAIRDKGAFVSIIVDACHSGTMTRGGPQERERLVPAKDLIPQEILKAAEERAAQRERSRGEPSAEAGILGPSSATGDMVALYAAQSTEFAPELPLPLYSEKARPQGLFTYTLTQVLQQSQTPLTYRELVERVNASYRTWRSQPTPMIEGEGMDREVLGLKEWPDRPKILLSNILGRRIEVNWGNLQGLHEQSILAVYPPAGEKDADKVIGHVQVKEVEPLRSIVEPVTFNEVPPPPVKKLVSGCRCKIVFVDYGDMQMRIAVQTQTGGNGAESLETHPVDKAPQPIESALRDIAKWSNNLVKRVDDPTKTDWFVRVVKDNVYLIPASGWTRTVGTQPKGGDSITPPQFKLGSLAKEEELATQLKSALTRIARARNLMYIATTGGGVTRGAASVDVNVELLRFKDKTDRQGEVIPYGSSGRTLHVGDLVAFQVTNPSRQSVDVTLLFIDSGYGIKAIFPKPGIVDDNRLLPHDTFRTPLMRVSKDTTGLENVVTIAVRAQTEKVDFSYLEQPTLEQVKGDAPHNRGLNSPLGQLLENAMYGKGSTWGMEDTQLNDRGMEDAQLNEHVVHLLSWQTIFAPTTTAETPPPEVKLSDLGKSFGAETTLVFTPQTVAGLLPVQPDMPWKPAVNPEKLRGGTEVFAKVAPAVVVIRTQNGHGAGFLISEDGFILTNHHVVASGISHDSRQSVSFVMVHLGRLSQDGAMSLQTEPRRAFVYKIDPIRDLALLKLETTPDDLKPLPYVQLAETPPRPGMSCAIIGHPSSGMLWTFRSGQVSSVGRAPQDLVDVVISRLAAKDVEQEKLTEMLKGMPARNIILTSCAANPGDSGSPVVDDNGRLIAVTFAIPADPAEAKFSYHVHLDEAKAFLEDRPKAATMLLPDPWDIGPRIQLADIDQDSIPDILLAGTQKPEALLFDLDNNTPASYLRPEGVDGLVREQKWDFEFAVHLRPTEQTAFYDTDNDGKVDLILIDNDPDDFADARYTLDEEGRWHYEADINVPLLSPDYFSALLLAKRFAQLMNIVLK